MTHPTRGPRHARRLHAARFARTAVLAAATASLVIAPALPAWSATDNTAAKPPASASPALSAAKQVGDAKEQIATLRKPKLSADDRQKAVDRLMDLGDEGASQLAAFAAPEFVKRREAYLGQFVQAAEAALRARVKENGGGQKVDSEIRAMRKQSLETSRAPGLTKAAVHDKCDPAVKRLTELMIVTPEQVFEAQPDLKTARVDALAWSGVYQAAAAKLTTDAARKKLPAAPPEPKDADAAVAAREKLFALLTTPMTKQDQSALTGNVTTAAAPGSKIDPEEAAAVLALNRLRILLGIGAQLIDPKLCAAGRGHSQDMFEKKFFAHESPVLGKETPWKRAGLAGTSANAENIFMGRPKGEQAIDAWWYSPGHHVNMMGDFKRTGVGVYKQHFTQMFGK